MKKHLFIGLLLLSYACSKEPAELPAAVAPVAVSLSVRPDAEMPISRATDENAVRDVNIYFVNSHTEAVYHTYAAGASVRAMLPPGGYTAYVTANTGRDLGDMPLSALPSLTLSAPGTDAELPMSAVAELSVLKAGTLPPISVRRNVAKVNLSVRLDPSVTGLRLLSYRVMNLPRYLQPFLPSDALSSPDAADYGTGESVTIGGNACSETLYLPENRQGVNRAIADQRQKNRENAPACATCINIRAAAGNAVYDYYVYPGENNTTDFNLKGNGIYNLTVTVKGTDEVDTRMDSYRVSFTEQPSSHAGYFVGGEKIRGKVSVECSGPQRRFRVKVRPERMSYFILNGEEDKTEYLFDLPAGGTFEYTVGYGPAVFNAGNSDLAYTVTVLDEEDYPSEYRCEHRYANTLTVYIPLSPGGTIAAAGALQGSESTSGGYRCKEILCGGTGCTLTAAPVPGSKFLGLYSTSGTLVEGSTAATYAFVPTATHQTFYARFSALPVRLDAQGTANCYIASRQNESYIFRHGVKGNGKRTTGLAAPAPNNIVSAAVLWESGPRGSVIPSAEVSGNDIVFTTGTAYGNALIGGFNAAGSIEWSWHIWVTDFDPNATAQSYTGGVVFMDRNLGALSATPGDISSWGLYYQWGRKDPFPAGLPEMSYAAGYEFRTVRGADKKGMTLGYATANPTHYIVGEELWISGLGYDYKDWLLVHNYNLWGNASTSTNSYIDASDKSIYDPCPPGWKLPDRGAWKNAGITVLRMNRAEGGVYLLYNQADDQAYYPFTGCLNGDSGKPVKPKAAYYWSTSPGPNSEQIILEDEAQGLLISNENGGAVVQPLVYSYRSRGCSVRCVRE